LLVVHGDGWSKWHSQHTCDFKELSQKVIQMLKSKVNEKNCGQMFEFYILAHVIDVEFFGMLKKYMESASPVELCLIFKTCQEKNGGMLKDVVELMMGKMKKENCSEWLCALEEGEIDDKGLWDKLGSCMTTEIRQLWNTCQKRIAKISEEMLAGENEIMKLKKRVASLENLPSGKK
jgi:hypothetical protein